MPLRKLISALALNIFVLPGAGQWSLKHKKSALFFAFLALAIITGFCFHLVGIITNDIQNVVVDQDIHNLFETATVLSANTLSKHQPLIRGYLGSLVLVYVLSFVDLILIYKES